MITAIILTENQETLIESCLSNLFNISHIILYDNCSKDKTVDLSRKALSKASHEIVEGKMPLGLATIQNMLVAKVQTPYLVWHYGNSVMYPNKIAESLRLFETYPQVGVVYSDLDYFSTESKQMKRVFASPFDKNLLMQRNIVTPNYMAKTEVYRTAGLYDTKENFDFEHDWIYRVAEKHLVLHYAESAFCLRGK